VSALPRRVVVALVLTAVGFMVLGVLALRGRDGAEPAGRTTTSSTSATPSAPPVPPVSIELRSDWYRKGNSRFSERGPVPTVSSLPSTSSTRAGTTTGPAGSG
jgi:hypothetical protein